MATIDYSLDAKEALADIKEAGKSVSISRETGGAVDSFTGVRTGGSTTAGTLHVVELPKLSGVSGEDYLNQYAEDMVKGKIRYLLAAAYGASFEPEVNDEIEMDSLKWEVLFCVPLRPADTSILYKIGVRRK